MKKDKAKDEALERTYPELNLEKWSIWQPAHSKNKQMKVVIERGAAQVKVSANSEYGPLTTEDQKVYYALIDLFWKWVQQQENGSTEKLSMSERYLSRILDKKWNGKVAKVVAQCLEQAIDGLPPLSSTSTPAFVLNLTVSGKSEHLAGLNAKI